MDSKEIQEGNKIIAEFCGLKCVMDEDCYPDHPEYHWEDLSGSEFNLFNQQLHWSFESAPPFNKKWDWLMPVVERIRDTKMIKGFVLLQTNKWEVLSEELTKVNKEKIWTAVVAFIKFYNEYKPQ